MKIKDALKALPLQVRLQAIENCRKYLKKYDISLQNKLNTDIGFLGSHSCLQGMFVFSETKQGREYWFNICYKYKI